MRGSLGYELRVTVREVGTYSYFCQQYLPAKILHNILESCPDVETVLIVDVADDTKPKPGFDPRNN